MHDFVIFLRNSKKLVVKDGNKVVFIYIEDNGRIIMENSMMIVLKNSQNDSRRKVERSRLKDEQDVFNMYKKVR